MFLVKLNSKKRNYFSIGKDYTNTTSIIIHSDTIFSALCNNLRKIYGKEELSHFIRNSLVKPLEEEQIPGCKISSCFHYVDIYKQGEFYKTVFFLPKPLIIFPLEARSQDYLNENAKVFKKIEFVSFEIIKKLQQNEKIALSQYHIIDGKYLVDKKDLEDMGLEGFLALLENSDEKLEKINTIVRKKISLYEILEEQKVKIDRKSRESVPYQWPKFKFNISGYYIAQEERIEYNLIPGFYFLFNHNEQFIKEDQISKVIASINLIKDEGIGGKRSLGCGLVDDIDIVTLDENFEYFSLFNNKTSKYYVNLSLVYPSPEDMQAITYFTIFGRSGFVYSMDTRSLRFNDVKFIEEGSIFNEKILGDLVKVASDEFVSQYHQVYKNGIGFYVKLGDFEVK